jgi:multiple sugar transport system ATP-binding protein
VPAVTLRNITKRFRKVVALDDISFEVKDGAFFTIVGPTNAGKTTTLRIVAGLETPNSGDLFFDDKNMNGVLPNQRDVALMFQNLALYPHKNGFDNIAFPLRVRKVSSAEIERRVQQVAGFLKIRHLLDRVPGTYSGGERQRVAFARTMVRAPALYMLDEPLANLDALIRLQMRNELKRIHQELGKTMLYVTHDQVEAMSMSDQIAVLDRGTIQQIGIPDDIYMRPTNQFVAGFFGAPPMNFISARIEGAGNYTLLKWDDYAVAATPLTNKLQKTAGVNGAVFGLRPEDMILSRADGLPGKIVSLEQLGLKTIVDVQLGSVVVRVSVPTTFTYKVRDRCCVQLNVQRGHLFDPNTGTNLTTV